MNEARFAGWFGSRKSHRERGRRRRRSASPRRLRLESLESRHLLATVSGLDLVSDTGVSADDLVTRDGRLSGQLSWTSSQTMFGLVEFDHNGDGTAEGLVSVSESGARFEYDPVQADSVLAFWEGSLEIRYRPVEYQSGGSVAGNWSSFIFTLDRRAPTAVSFAPSGSVYSAPTELHVTYSEPLDGTSISPQSVTAIGDQSGTIEAQSVSLAAPDRVVATYAEGAFAPDQYATYSSQATDLAGNTAQLQFASEWQYLVAPTATSIAPVEVTANAPNTEISLYEVFDDVETPDAQLILSVSYDTASGLFDAVQIDPSTGVLQLDYAQDATGSTSITVEATDQDGLSVSTTFPVTVNADNAPPQIVEFGGSQGHTYWTFTGTILDEEPGGLTVTFGGLLEGLSAVSTADGFFEIQAIIGSSGTVTAQTTDRQDLDSNVAIEYVIHS